MDIITKSYFKNFLSTMKISGEESDANFEKFVNNLVFSPMNSRGFNLPKLNTGNGADAGIDGFALIINGKFIYTTAELAEIIDGEMEFSVEFHFVQSKVSEKFETKEFSNFALGVIDMFREAEAPKKVMNDLIESKYKMIQLVLNNFEYTKSRKCFLYYVTPGKYVEDANHTSALSKIEQDLNNLEIFDKENIKINIFDKTDIRKRYEKAQVQNKAEFKLINKIELPYIEGVSESYFSIMPIKEFFEIIIDEDNNEIRKGIFELNVRDFGGIENNRVNLDIEKTLTSSNKNNFGLLNNGITIVGSSLTKSRDKYIISNFYVVNGCQTTNVLFENRDKIDDDMWISVKFVITQESNLINDIVKATNNQTEVTEIQLLSMNEYQDFLESYYKSETRWTKLYYEKRNGQYNSIKGISSQEIIEPESQIKTFASVFLKSPHIASRFVGKLHEEISKSIFLSDHNPIMYYTSSLINYHLNNMILNGQIKSEFHKFHQHILLIISLLVWKNKKMPQFQSKKEMDCFCIELIEVISSEEEFTTLVTESLNILTKVVTNLNDTEITKSAKLVNQLQLYASLKLTEPQLQNIAVLLTSFYGINYHLKPITNISLEGDFRYNLGDRLQEFNQYITRNINSINLESVIVTEAIHKINILTNDGNDDNLTREQRKSLCSDIVDEVDNITNELKRVYDSAKRYIK